MGNKKEQIVSIFDTELEITYVINGKDAKSTMIDPEEYAGLEIISVRVRDLDIEVLELLSDSQMVKIKDQIEP